MENMADYHELYAQSEALLLSDIFQIFGDKFLKMYNVDLVISIHHLN